MQTSLLRFTGEKWIVKGGRPDNPDLVLCFLSTNLPHTKSAFDTLREVFPKSAVVGCTTGGEIFEDEVFEGGAVGIALKFESSSVKLARAEQTGPNVSFNTGESLAKDLLAPDLVGVFIVSDGLLVNGSKLVEGL